MLRYGFLGILNSISILFLYFLKNQVLLHIFIQVSKSSYKHLLKNNLLTLSLSRGFRGFYLRYNYTNMTAQWQYPSTPELEFAIIQEDEVEVEEVSMFLLQHFFTQEPLGQALKLDVNQEVSPWLRRVVAHVVQKKISLVVRNHETRQIVAVCLNDVEREEKDNEDVTMLTEVQSGN